jgi:Sulfatase
VKLRPKALVRTLLVAMGFTTLFLLWVIKPAVEPQQDALYHWSGPARNFFLPVTLDFLTFWLVLVVLLLAARNPGRLRATIWCSLLSFTPWFVGQTLHALDLTPTTHQLDRLLFLLGVLATLLVALLWRTSFAPRLERIIDSATTILVFTGLFGLFMLSQLAFRSWQSSRLMGKFPLHPAVTATIQPHRIIWIVLDELSFQQAFEHRYPGLQLPALDAFAASATNFSHAQPFDIYTEVVLPGLMAGKPFDAMQTSPTVELSVHNEVTGKWQPFHQDDTVFQDALNQGYRTAATGWYNPYCRIIPSVLDSCYWTYRYPSNLMLPSNSLLANMLAPMKLLTWMALNTAPARVRVYCMNRLHIPMQKALITQGHIDDYLDLDARADALLRDRSYGFVLLHLPVPHPWGIYDRSTGKFTTTGSSYINNLALADKCLAGIRQTLEQTGQWDSSTILLMGDHSWRTQQLWRLPKVEFRWAKEDEIASHGGQYDPRPAYIVKLPNQTTTAHIDTLFHTVNTRKLFDAIMAHQIHTPADLATWAQTTH